MGFNHKLQLNYQNIPPLQNIDIDKLRPSDSYDFLIKNRNGELQKILDNPLQLSKFLVKRTCPLCKLNKSKKILNKDNLDIVKCDNCNLIYVNPVFDSKLYQSIYKSDSYKKIGQKLSNKSHDYRLNRFGKERADFIIKYHSKDLPKTYLDIGCSTGFTVEALLKKGWESRGLELNPATAKFGRERGLNIKEIDFLELDDNNKFSAISLFDVLEHLFDPSKVLEKAFNLLNDGGNIFIYVPNWDSASRFLIGEEKSHFIWPTHHLTYYVPETLIKHLEKYGFKILHWETQGLDLFDWAWVEKEKLSDSIEFLNTKLDLLQSYINSSGHGKNLRVFARKVI